MAEEREKLKRLEALLARQTEGGLAEKEAAELRDVLADDAQARRFYIGHCEMQAMLDEERGILALLAEQPNVVSLPVSGGATGSTRSEASENPPAPQPTIHLRIHARRAAFGFACAAAGMLVALVVGPLANRPSTPVSETPIATARPAVALVRETRLPDGSTVELAPRSAVSVHFESSERALELQSGEAHFSVTPDAERPFVVTAGVVRVRAVGTAFNVRRAGERVIVTVTEGQVEVSRPNAPKRKAGSAAARSGDVFVVPAGGQFRWDDQEPGAVLASVNPSEALSWREGRLEYVNEPLRAVIADLNRYHDRPVVIRDEALGRLRVTGTVFTDSIGEWLAGLPDGLPLRVEARNDDVILDVPSPRS